MLEILGSVLTVDAVLEPVPETLESTLEEELVPVLVKLDFVVVVVIPSK